MKKSTTKSSKPLKVPAAVSPGFAAAKPVRKAAPAVAAGVEVKTERKAPASIPAKIQPERSERNVMVAAPVAAPVTKVERKAPVKMPAAKATSTTIVAQINVGYGNSLYIRGEGPGLSWDRGLAMDCISDDKWSITISDATVPVTFKFLLNDITWCAGGDYVAEPGASFAVVPIF